MFKFLCTALIPAFTAAASPALAAPPVASKPAVVVPAKPAPKAARIAASATPLTVADVYPAATTADADRVGLFKGPCRTDRTQKCWYLSVHTCVASVVPPTCDDSTPPVCQSVAPLCAQKPGVVFDPATATSLDAIIAAGL